MDNTKYGKRRGKLSIKIEEISGGKAHTNTQKLNFDGHRHLSQSGRVNVCEHTAKMASLDSF